MRDAAIYCRLRAYYNKHLHPLMIKYLTVWFHDLWAWLGQHGVLLHVQQVTAVTIGRDFQPLSHVDADFGPTVLVCLHEGEGPVRGNLLLACCSSCGDHDSQGLLLAFEERLLQLLQHTGLPRSALLLDERVDARTRSRTRR